MQKNTVKEYLWSKNCFQVMIFFWQRNTEVISRCFNLACCLIPYPSLLKALMVGLQRTACRQSTLADLQSLLRGHQPTAEPVSWPLTSPELASSLLTPSDPAMLSPCPDPASMTLRDPSRAIRLRADQATLNLTTCGLDWLLQILLDLLLPSLPVNLLLTTRSD